MGLVLQPENQVPCLIERQNDLADLLRVRVLHLRRKDDVVVIRLIRLSFRHFSKSHY
jgi:hypothetical protein